MLNYQSLVADAVLASSVNNYKGYQPAIRSSNVEERIKECLYENESGSTEWFISGLEPDGYYPYILSSIVEATRKAEEELFRRNLSI